jgi:ferredoxin
MTNPRRPEIGSTLSIPAAVLDQLLERLEQRGYQLVGPRIQGESLIYAEIHRLSDLPQGYSSEQAPASFKLRHTSSSRYFDVIPGGPSWKQYLFPPRHELFKLRRNGGWEPVPAAAEAPAYAFIGVRACELAAIQIQDRAFLRTDFTDPIYRARREKAFLLAVNCLHPAATCFCASLGAGPRVGSGYDLLLTELEDTCLLTVGSELARDLLDGLPGAPASAFLLNAAEQGLQRAAAQMERSLDVSDLPRLILDNLDNPHWQQVAQRCLSCGNCTQVCPTCFCWDATDESNLTGTETRRERVWDSCFNPGYSYQAGGNTRPTIRARYRQWLSHKLGTWKEQYDTFGCVGCGRCITWCPAGIDLTEEIPALRREAQR